MPADSASEIVIFTISIPRESCTNAKAKYSSRPSVVPADPSVQFYHCPHRLVTDCSDAACWLVCEGCEPCECDVGGSAAADCHQLTGRCACLAGTTGLACDTYVSDRMPSLAQLNSTTRTRTRTFLRRNSVGSVRVRSGPRPCPCSGI